MTVLTEIGFKSTDEKEEKGFSASSWSRCSRQFIPAGSRWRRWRRPRGKSDTFGLSEKKQKWVQRCFDMIACPFLFLFWKQPNNFSLDFYFSFQHLFQWERGGRDQISLFVFKWAVSFLWELGRGGEFQIWKPSWEGSSKKGGGIWNWEFETLNSGFIIWEFNFSG